MRASRKCHLSGQEQQKLHPAKASCSSGDDVFVKRTVAIRCALVYNHVMFDNQTVDKTLVWRFSMPNTIRTCTASHAAKSLKP